MDACDISIPILTDPGMFDLVVPHAPPEAPHQGIPKHNTSHLGLLTRLLLLILLNAILEVHDFHTRDRHFHGIVLGQQQFFKVIVIRLSILLGVQVDVDVLLLGEGQVEVKTLCEAVLGLRVAEDEVVEVGVAVPFAVVGEETPVYAVLAE